MHDFWLKALAAIAEDLGSVLRAKTKTNKKKPQKQTTTTTKKLTMAYNSASRASGAIFWFHEAANTWCTHINAGTHTS